MNTVARIVKLPKMLDLYRFAMQARIANLLPPMSLALGPDGDEEEEEGAAEGEMRGYSRAHRQGRQGRRARAGSAGL